MIAAVSDAGYFATRRAGVGYDPMRVAPRALAQAVLDAGYEVAALDTLGSARQRAEALEDAEAAEQHRVRRDFFLALSLALPVLVVAMSHGATPVLAALWTRWLQLVLTTAIVFGPGARLLRLAWNAARHRSSDMNTLVSSASCRRIYTRARRCSGHPCFRTPSTA